MSNSKKLLNKENKFENIEDTEDTDSEIESIASTIITKNINDNDYKIEIPQTAAKKLLNKENKFENIEDTEDTDSEIESIASTIITKNINDNDYKIEIPQTAVDTSKINLLISTNIDSPDSEELTPSQKRTLLFNINQPLELSMQKFDDDWWPLVSNVWTGFNLKKKANGDSSQTYTCRFTKIRESSTRKEGIPSNKWRKTKIRLSNLCFAKIKVSRFVMEKKVRVERFKDSPNHTHPLEDSDRLKCPQVIRNLVEQEAIKNYRPPAILSAVKEYVTEKMDLSASVKELRTKEVVNIKYKIRGSLDTYLIGDPERELDIRDFAFINQIQIENLEKYGWLTLIDSTHKTNRAHFFVSNEDSDTIAEALMIIRRFANIEANSIKLAFPGLKNGEQKCDSIFCTVYLMRTWMSKIYEVKTRQKMIQAMYKRTKIGCEDLIQQAINECPVPTIKQYISRYYKKNNQQWALWARQHSSLLLQVTSTNSLESYHSELKRTTSPRYGLIGACHKDQSNIEANSIKLAFPGLKNGEQKCDSIFCTVYLMRTWMSKIYEVKTRQKMIQAMYKRTKIGCEDLIQQAINECPVPTIKQYISRYYKKNNQQWALWARQHSSLLLQVTSTNSLESYHSELKRTTSPRYGLIDSEYVAFEFRTKKISVMGLDDEILNEFYKFPYPIQRILADEVCAVENRIEKGKSAPGMTSATKLLTANSWRNFQWMFEEGSFEIYIRNELIEVDISKQTKAERATEN
ncbi:hypothetical protein Glove_395g66 [Diversispora epigaea]|uniref:MULE transposase domain-containing protein n=1 Tax=Diversispora epigaea TaxID=1348612 RepID=A0A397H1K4_9GLOM|nr:hypothetical protein Glove_395g66 [Diversispora epigaea]